MNDYHRTLNIEEKEPAAQPENEDSSPSPEPDRKRVSKQKHESDHMKKVFTTLAENAQQQLRAQGEKHAMEIVGMKQANLDTHNILTTKTTPAQTINYNRTTAHFTVITKPSETLLYRTRDNWPAFKENPTIRLNHELTSYQPIDHSTSLTGF
jgi:hypothetical protein